MPDPERTMSATKKPSQHLKQNKTIIRKPTTKRKKAWQNSLFRYYHLYYIHYVGMLFGYFRTYFWRQIAIFGGEKDHIHNLYFVLLLFPFQPSFSTEVVLKWRIKTNAQKGAWKWNFPPLKEIMIDRPIIRPTDGQFNFKTKCVVRPEKKIARMARRVRRVSRTRKPCPPGLTRKVRLHLYK